MSHFAVRLLRVIAVFLLLACPALAGSQDWTVTRATKQVSYTVDKTTWHPVEAGSIIPNQAWISTGPRGRTTLSRGTESISLQPNTLGAVITTQGLFSRKTDVVQQKGQMALNIEKRSRPHTFVHTPYLAAVVKGTTFTVTVTDLDASVSVEEGLVQVSSFTGGQSTNVGPGQQVTVDQAQEMSVAGVVEAPSIVSVEPTRASIAAVGQKAPLGEGLSLGSQGSQNAPSSDEANASGGVSGESSESGRGRDARGEIGNSNSDHGDNDGVDSDRGNGGRGLGENGPGGKGHGDKGPDGKGPGDKGLGGKGPGGKGHDDKGPGGRGPDGKGPDGKGPDGKGPGGDKGPSGKGPRGKDSD